MRKFLIIIAVLCYTGKSYGQAAIGKMYTIVPDFINVYGVDKDNKIDSTHAFRASSNTKFTVTGYDKNNNIKITFWRYPAKPSHSDSLSKSSKRSGYRSDVTFANVYKFDSDKVYIDRWANYLEFAISPTTFNSSCIPYFGGKEEFTWGIMTLPIKVRFGNNNDRFFNYEEKLNLGFVFGKRYQLQGKIEQSINILAGFGVTNVRIDSLSQKSGKVPEASSSAAFSFNMGCLYQYDNFQIGLFLGQDRVSGQLGRDWRYQGKTWIGLAVGLSLYSRNSSQGGEGSNESKGQ